MANYILSQGNNVFSNGNYVFETGDTIKPPVLDLDPSAIANPVAGMAVSLIPDISGNNNHARQIVAANQPALRLNEVGGYAAVEGDGTTDYMQLTAEVYGKTIFMVFKNKATSQGYSFPFSFGNGTSQTVGVGYWDGGQGQGVLRSDIVQPGQYFTSDPVNSFYLNGGKQQTLNSNKVSFYTLMCLDVAYEKLAPITTLWLRASGGGISWNGYIARLIVYDFRLNFAERTMKTQELLTKYALNS